MQRLKTSFLTFSLLMASFSLSITTFAEEPSALIETSTIELLDSRTTFSLSNQSAISWKYENVGKPSGLIGYSSPLISHYIRITGDADYTLRMLLDGKQVHAQYDDITGYLTYPTSNLTGTHKVEVQLDVYGKTYPIANWNFTVNASPINPFEGKNQYLLATIQDEAIIRMNTYRSALSIPLFASSESLQKAAQAHSNYMALNHVTGHTENPKSIGYTGTNPWDRGGYFGFTGNTGEGITYTKKTGSLGVDDLMDAPYHRLSIINPFNHLAGVGYNNRGDIVINYGSFNSREKRSDVVLYPFDKQKNAKTNWFVLENPNPLRFWKIDREYVGYPISYAYFTEDNNDQLLIKNLSLKNKQQENIPFYDVTPDRDNQGKHHVFLIPKSPLEPGQTYSAYVEATVVDTKGNEKDVSRAWSFTTAGGLDIHDIYFSKYKGTNFINLKYNSGEDPQAIVQIEKDGQVYLTRDDGGQITYKPITAGNFELTVESPLFKEYKTIPITIKKNNDSRYDDDADWTIVSNGAYPIEKDTVPPVIHGVENMTIPLLSTFNPKANVTAIDDVDGDLTDVIIVNGDVDTTRAGSYTLTYRVSDSSGNITSKTREIVVVENEIPSVPIVDTITNVSTVVTGRADSGTIITATLNNVVLGSTKTTATGTFILPIPAQTFGAQLYFTASDEQGNSSEEVLHTVMDVVGLNNYHTSGPEKFESPHKEWTIQFNEKLNPATVTPNSIYVHFNQLKLDDFKVVINEDLMSVTVMGPEDGYELGKTYFLYIDGSVTSMAGKALNKPIKHKFTILGARF